MGRDYSDHSESPVRNHRSSRRSPSRRERSPPRHKSSHSTRSPVREKPSSRTKSPKRPKSPLDRLPAKEAPSSRARSPVRANSRSPVSRSPSPRSKRLRRDRSNHHKDDKSSERGHGKTQGKSRSPARPKSRSPESRSLSPRSRRLRRAQDDKVSDKGSRKERDAERGARDEGNRSRDDDRNEKDDSVARMKAAEEALQTKEKQKPSFELSGKLAAETNRVKGVTLLFTEPPDARKPEIRWRLYVFKGGEALNEPLYVHRQTCYLFGRERRVADIPTDHPSCSKQHAVLQYRQVDQEQADGMLKKVVRPYIMDLGSTNGTFINENRIEPERYYELMEKDTIKFGNSSREYVLLHENSAT